MSHLDNDLVFETNVGVNFMLFWNEKQKYVFTWNIAE